MQRSLLQLRSPTFCGCSWSRTWQGCRCAIHAVVLNQESTAAATKCEQEPQQQNRNRSSSDSSGGGGGSGLGHDATPTGPDDSSVGDEVDRMMMHQWWQQFIVVTVQAAVPATAAMEERSSLEGQQVLSQRGGKPNMCLQNCIII